MEIFRLVGSNFFECGHHEFELVLRHDDGGREVGLLSLSFGAALGIQGGVGGLSVGGLAGISLPKKTLTPNSLTAVPTSSGSVPSPVRLANHSHSLPLCTSIPSIIPSSRHASSSFCNSALRLVAKQTPIWAAVGGKRFHAMQPQELVGMDDMHARGPSVSSLQ